jgi:hypothetical protein
MQWSKMRGTSNCRKTLEIQKKTKRIQKNPTILEKTPLVRII